MNWDDKTADHWVWLMDRVSDGIVTGEGAYQLFRVWLASKDCFSGVGRFKMWPRADLTEFLDVHYTWDPVGTPDCLVEQSGTGPNTVQMEYANGRFHWWWELELGNVEGQLSIPYTESNPIPEMVVPYLRTVLRTGYQKSRSVVIPPKVR